MALLCTILGSVLGDAATSEANSTATDTASALYVDRLQKEYVWAQSVKDLFNEQNIGAACPTFKPGSYPDCYLKFLNEKTGNLSLASTSLIQLEVIGIGIVTNARKVLAKADKGLAQTISQLDVAELTLNVLEKDRTSARSRKIGPPGPEADVIARVDENTHGKFQLEALQKTSTILAKTGAASCIIRKTCPGLVKRQTLLEQMYKQAKAEEAPNFHPLSAQELSGLMSKANLSPEVAKMIAAGN